MQIKPPRTIYRDLWTLPSLLRVLHVYIMYLRKIIVGPQQCFSYLVAIYSKYSLTSCNRDVFLLMSVLVSVLVIVAVVRSWNDVRPTGSRNEGKRDQHLTKESVSFELQKDQPEVASKTLWTDSLSLLYSSFLEFICLTSFNTIGCFNCWLKISQCDTTSC